MECQEELEEVFTEMVLFMNDNLEDFGKTLMVDGKAIQSFATKPGRAPKSGRRGERDSHKWKRLYKRRTGVERINGRVDRDYKFEKRTIRGLDKMTMFITETFLVYMGMAKAKILTGETEHLCKLYA